MKDFAIYNYKEPMNRRGETCLDQFRKNSNREWAQRFFILNLECWKHWIELATKTTDTKGSKKILKNAEYLDKYKIQLPAEDLYYNEYLPAAAQNHAVPVPRQPENPPNRPTQQPQNRGNTRPNQPATGSNNNQNLPVYQETEVRSTLKAVKENALETSSMFAPLTEFPDYLVDVLEHSIGQFKNSNKVFQAVIGNPSKYPASLVEEVTQLVSCVEPAIRAINEFEVQNISFKELKQVWNNCSTNLSQKKQSSLAVPTRNDRQDRNSQADSNPAQGRRQEDQPISNNDMNSYMSAVMNQKIKIEEEGEGEDDIRLPDQFAPEEDEYPKPSQKPKPKDDFEDDDDDDEGDFGHGKSGAGHQFGDPMAPKEFEDEEYNQVDEADFEEPDIADKPEPKEKQELKQSGISIPSKEQSNQSKQFIKPGKYDFKFEENFDDEEVEDEKENYSPPPQHKPQPQVSKPQSVTSKQQSGRDLHSQLRFDTTPKHTPKQDKTNEMHFSVSQSQARFEDHNGFEMPGENAHNQLDDFEEEDSYKPPETKKKEPTQVITEEEKVKLAIQNQKVLNNPKAQNVLNDFFSKEAEPQSNLFDPTDVFARAKMKLKKPQEPVQPEPTKPKQKKPQDAPPPRPAPVETRPPKQEIAPEPDFSVKPSSSKASLNKHQPKQTDHFNQPVSDPFNLNKETKIQTKIPDSNLPADMNESKNEEDGFFDTDEFFKDEGNKNGQYADVAAGFAGGWGEADEGFQARGEPEDREENQFEDAREFDEQAQKELEEYLKDRNNQHRNGHEPEPQTPNEEEKPKNYAAQPQGGLLDDAEPEYFAPLNLDKMREEIRRLEQERVNREAEENANLEKRKREEAASQPKQPPAHKPLQQDPPHHRKPEPEPVAPSPKPTPQKPDPFEKYQAPISSQHKKQNPSVSQDLGRPLRRQGTGQHNISQLSDNFQKSDFFNDYGSPTKLQAISSALRPNQQMVRRMNDEEQFFQPSDINSVKPSNEHPADSREATEIKQENERLKRENFILSNEKKVLDKKLEEVMNGTVKKLKEELAMNGSQSMSVKLNLLENDLKLAINEKSMYMQKYKELYTKYKSEKEAEKETVGLLDPKKILELSQLTVVFAEEKKALQEQLAEERQKTVILDSLKEELERTKAELQSRTRIQLQMDMSNALAATNSAILGPIKDLSKEQPTFQGNMFHHSTDQRHQLQTTMNNSRSSEPQHFLRQPENGQPTHDLGRLHGAPIHAPQPDFLASHHPISRVSAGVDDIGLFDESDMDFLANFHKEFDQAVSKIKKSEPYKFTSINKDTRSSLNAIDNDYDFLRHTVGHQRAPNTRPSAAAIDRSFELDLRNSAKDRNLLSQYSTYQPAKPFADLGSRAISGQVHLTHQHKRLAPRSSSNSEERFERNSLGRLTRNQVKPLTRTNPMLEPFNKIYDEIPLPNRFASAFQPAGMKDSGISELRVSSAFFHKDVQQPQPGRQSTISQPEVHKNPPHPETKPADGEAAARNGKLSQFSAPVGKPQSSFPTQKDPPRETHKPQGPLYPSVAGLSSENVLNFKAASVFDKGVLFVAKKKFEVSCSSLKRSSPQDPVASFELAIKALNSSAALKVQLAQRNSKVSLMKTPTASLLQSSAQSSNQASRPSSS